MNRQAGFVMHDLVHPAPSSSAARSFGQRAMASPLTDKYNLGAGHSGPRHGTTLRHASKRMSPPGNFGFLGEHSPLLADLGATAERLFPYDPASCVLKLRLLAEALTQDIAARLGITLDQPSQAELLRAVDVRLGMLKAKDLDFPVRPFH